MEILLKNLEEIEENIQKLSVIDKEKFEYFQHEIQVLRNKLIELEDTNSATLQQEIDEIISNINRVKHEFSNYMKTGAIEKMQGKLFFELPEQDDNNISGNEKIKRHRLGLLASTVELVKKDVQLDFSKIEQAISKFNIEKSNTGPEYSIIEIAYIDKLIAELFIEYQRKYYQENGRLPLEKPANYCNMDTYKSVISIMASKKLIEEKERISRIEGLILDGQVVNSNEIWNMLSGDRKVKQGELTTLNSNNKQNENPPNQLIPVKSRKKVNNNLVLTIRKKNIFGDLVERTKKIKLGVNGIIRIPESMRINVVKAILPEGITFIGYAAFRDCINLSEVFIPESVNEIGMYSFQRCLSLKNINLPENLTKLRSECFRNSGLLSIKIPKNVLEIEDCAFSGSALRQVILQDGLKKIDYGAFMGTNLEKIKIPDSVESLGKKSLECPYINEISLPKSLEGTILNSIGIEEVRGPNIIIRGKDVIPNTTKKPTSRTRTIGRTRE